MKITVLIAGVADPKWPLALGADGRPACPPERFVMSPFDESALEMALRLRDADPDAVSITALVMGGQNAVRLARAVVALNVADVACLDVPFDAGCDIRYLARALTEFIPADCDLVLVGREFGDCDNGVLPPLLASMLDRAFFGRAQSVGARFLREQQACEQWVGLASPMVVSATNDRRTRLRKPLMKNVILARQAQIAVHEPQATGRPCLAVRQVAPVVALRAPIDGPKLRGASPEHARNLIDLVREKMSA
jgi:electron transfer flavoprotein beta subunit